MIYDDYLRQFMTMLLIKFLMTMFQCSHTCSHVDDDNDGDDDDGDGDDDDDKDGDDDDNDVAVFSHLRARSSNSASLLPQSQRLWMD